MIKARIKARIIKALGKHYSGKILKEFARKNIVNAKGEAYKAQDIRKLVGGDWEQEPHETVILQFLKRTEANNKRKAARRKVATSKK